MSHAMSRRARARVTLGLGLAAALTGVAMVAGGDDPTSDVGARAWAVTSATPRSLTVPEFITDAAKMNSGTASKM